jgi:carboxymethylenebutenolidase
MMRALHHASYTFAKRLSHTADSQDQRHRMVPASRPLMTFADTTATDYVVPGLVAANPKALAVLESAMHAAWAAKNGGSADRLAITGFCWGGRIVWLYAAHNPKLMAGAAWYGRLEGGSNALTPKNPIDYAAVLKAPVIGFYGGKDTGIPLESIERMRGALKVLDDDSQINVYPDAQHGFNADYRPSYKQDDAQDAWKKMLAWFKRAGV